MAAGKMLSELVNNDNGLNFMAQIPYSHYEKYIKDVYQLEKNSIGIEPRRRNIFYDENNGFTTIDVGLITERTEDNEEHEDTLEDVYYFWSMFYPLLMIKNDSNPDLTEAYLLRMNLLRMKWKYEKKLVKLSKNFGYILIKL